jgi:hypothetical protein
MQSATAPRESLSTHTTSAQFIKLKWRHFSNSLEGSDRVLEGSNMLRQNWTPEAEATLREMASQGVYVRRIALRLKRSESSIKKRATLLGLTVSKAPRSNFRFDRIWESAR